MNFIRHTVPTLNYSAFSPLARLRAFQHEVDHLFDVSALQRGAASLDGSTPVLDLYQDNDQFLVMVELPGMKKEDITLSLHDGLLTISGDRLQMSSNGKSVLRNERFFGRFERTVTLPAQVDGTRVNATYEDGILTVTLPKAEAAKPRQIEIAAK